MANGRYSYTKSQRQKLAAIHEVPESCEPTQELPDPYEGIAYHTRTVERPTIPMPFHGIALDKLEFLIAKKRG